MKKKLLLAIALLLVTVALVACGSEEEPDLPTPIPEIQFEDFPTATPQPEEPTATPEPHAENLEGETDETPATPIEELNKRVNDLETLTTIIQENLLNQDNNLAALQMGESESTKELETRLIARINTVTEQYMENLDDAVQEELIKVRKNADQTYERVLLQQESQYEQLLKDIRSNQNLYLQAYQQAIRENPAPYVRFYPFIQVAVDRTITDLEWVLDKQQKSYAIPRYGVVTIFNLNEQDLNKVMGISYRQGDMDGRGVIPGYVPHQFPNENYRSSRYYDLRYYEPNSDTETTVNNQNGQGMYFKPTNPIGLACAEVKYMVSRHTNGTWSEWTEEADSCNPNGINEPGRYIIAVATNVQR